MEDIFKVISKRSADAHQLFQEKKLDEALTYYTDDFISLYPGYELLRGDKNALKAFWETCYRNGGTEYKVQMEKVEQLSEDSAYHVTTVKYFDGDGNVTNKVKAVVIWKKIGDEWRYHVDCCNSTNAEGNTVFDKSK